MQNDGAEDLSSKRRIIGDVDAELQIVGEVDVGSERNTGRFFSVRSIEVITTDERFKAVASEQWSRATDFDIETAVSSFDALHGCGRDRSPRNERTGQSRVQNVGLVTQREVPVRVDGEPFADRFKADASLVVGVLVSVIVVPEARDTRDAVAEFVEPSQTAADRAGAAAVPVGSTSSIEEDQRTGRFESEWQHHVDGRFALTRAAQPLADPSFQQESRSEFVLPDGSRRHVIALRIRWRDVIRQGIGRNLCDSAVRHRRAGDSV